MATNPHIYVSSVHGTNTGASDTSYASQQTGAMTSLTAGNVYTTIQAAINGASPSGSDTVYLADNHAADYNPGVLVTIPGGVKWISVSASNIDQYSPGASEHLNDSTFDYYLNTVSTTYPFYGLDLETGDDIFANSNSADSAQLLLVDCTLRPDSSGDYGFRCLNASSGIIRLVNTDIIANNAGAGCAILGSGVHFLWEGGSLQTAATLIECGGPWNAIFRGVDLSSATTLVFDEDGADSSFTCKMYNCRLNSGVTLPTPVNRGSRFEMYNCDDSTGNDQHRFYVADRSGTAKNNDSTYVTAMEVWSYDGTSKSSIEVTTTANCSHDDPFVFELPAQFIDLSSTASDLLTLNLVTDSTAVSLTDTELAAYLVYPDGTSAAIPRSVTSGRTASGYTGNDPLHAGTTLGTSALGAGDWTGEPASANFYKVELDTSGTAGSKAVCSIRVEVYKASIASGDLYIHPILSVA